MKTTENNSARREIRKALKCSMFEKVFFVTVKSLEGEAKDEGTNK